MRASSLGFKSLSRMPFGNFVAFAKSALVHSGLSSSKTGSLVFRGMAPHLLCVRAAKADRTVFTAAKCKYKAMRRSIDQSISSISRLPVIETIINNDRLNLEIDPARERHAVFGQIDRFLRRIELNQDCVYNLLF